MADRVESHADLEDVLSSIRRLVSQNADAAETPALVLTEAERVLDEEVLRPAPQPIPSRVSHIHSAPAVEEAAYVHIAPDLDDEEIADQATDFIAQQLEDLDDTPSELDEAGMPEFDEEPAADPRQTIHTGPDPIDLNVLREMVTDIVREELRGPMGQKITRNVRKLVRQEIQRAVNARTLD